jgi:hypothetical protein
VLTTVSNPVVVLRAVPLTELVYFAKVLLPF